MNASYLDYRATNHFQETVLRYIAQDAQLTPFISHWPTIEGFSKILDQKQVRANRSLLVEIIKKQYAEINLKNSLVGKQIEALVQPNTFSVTTGHQLNLFAGPLYFIYKIVTTIKLTQDLAKHFPNKNFVPIYWMASEDHDFQEINHSYIKGNKIIWEHTATGATGRLDLKDITQAVGQYSSLLGISIHAQQLTELIQEAYSPDHTLAQATRHLAHRLFEHLGLVVLDADAAELKMTFRNIISNDIFNQHSFQKISQTDNELAKINIQAQGHVREINFFYLCDNLRERIVYKNGLYEVLHTDICFDTQQLQTEIMQNPERFSPNVMMRPLYQELILPNIAYVGGSAEIAYWLQLKGNFDYYGINFPILIPRNSALIIDKKQVRQLRKIGISLTELFEPPAKIQNNWIKKHTQHTLDLTQQWQELALAFHKISTQASAIDISLVASTQAIQIRTQKAIQRLEKKLLKAEKRNYQEALFKIEQLKKILFPQNTLQERIENFGPFYAKHGPAFIQSLMNAFQPLDFKFTVLQEKDL